MATTTTDETPIVVTTQPAPQTTGPIRPPTPTGRTTQQEIAPIPVTYNPSEVAARTSFQREFPSGPIPRIAGINGGPRRGGGSGQPIRNGITREQRQAEADRANLAEASHAVDVASALDRQRTQARDRRAMNTFNSSDPISRPSISDLENFLYSPAQPDVATLTEIDDISNRLIETGVPPDEVTFVLWDLARYCADAGSSEFTTMVGFSVHSPDVSRERVAAIIKNVTTLRRFCAFYAKIVWNIMIKTNIPPSDWIRKGYRENTKFAAFDFFYGVVCHASLEPDDGLVRKPFHEEIIANQANKGTVIFRQESAKDKTASTAHEITGGRSGPRARLTLKGSD